jgi:hypothetical protein
MRGEEGKQGKREASRKSTGSREKSCRKKLQNELRIRRFRTPVFARSSCFMLVPEAGLEVKASESIPIRI